MKNFWRFVFVFATLAALGNSVRALDFTLQPIPGGPFRYKDCNTQVFSDDFIANYAYSNAQVSVSIDSSSGPYLNVTIQATGLKPNFAYQIKLSGRSTKLDPGNGDDATNERLGLIGRWWRAYPNPANSDDGDYFANKDNPNYAYTGYLIVGFFITDENGNAGTTVAGDNSFHVLWRTNQRPPTSYDGPVYTFTIPATKDNPAYDVSYPAAPLGIYGEWEPTRAAPGSLEMPSAHYICDFVLTEESFHDFSQYAGDWTAAMGASIEFDIGTPSEVQWNTPADIVYPAPLDATELNATAPEPGMFEYTPSAGTVLPAGTHTLTVQFTPDSTGVALPLVYVRQFVQQGTPNVIWNPPQNIRANQPLDGTILNATASVPGQFSYNPPLGTWLVAGDLNLSLQFIPTDSVNYIIPGAIEFDVNVVTALLVTCGPYATPNPAYAGSPVQFTAMTEARGISWSWDFGDGTPPAKTGVTAHAYAAPGNYTATVTAQVPRGRSEAHSVGVTILSAPTGDSNAAANGGADADGDGFSNALELAWGSDPTNTQSTPLGGASALAANSMRINTLNARITGTPASGSYQIQLKGVLSVSKLFSVANAKLGVDAGGVARVVNLDATGRTKFNGITVLLKELPASTDAQFLGIDLTMTGPNTALSSEWSAPYTTGEKRAFKVMLILGGNAYSAQSTLTVKNSNQSVLLK